MNWSIIDVTLKMIFDIEISSVQILMMHVTSTYYSNSQVKFDGINV